MPKYDIYAAKEWQVKTISGGILDLTDDWGRVFKVEGEGTLDDELDSISGLVDGQEVILFWNGTNTITLKHGTGNLNCINGTDILLNADNKIAVIIYHDDESECIVWSNTGAGVVLTSGNNPLTSDWSFGKVGFQMATGLSDGEYLGFVEAGVAGTALTFGESIYQASADDKWEKTKADALATSGGKIGICLTSAAEDAAILVLLWGKVRADSAFPSMTPYDPVFLSAATAGAITMTAPSGVEDYVVRNIGYPNTENELYFCPSLEWTVLNG